ncbi:MAG: hypothetical protein QOF51_3585, partial [Chloroflexota bacterium]|nr:hypothetical protein [Chloroflexota bacterium]
MSADLTFGSSKQTGTHADVFAAVGLADLLASAAGNSSVRLFEDGPRFRVQVAGAIDLLEDLHPTPGYPFLQAKTEAIPAGISSVVVVSYQDERKRVDLYNQTRKAIREKKATEGDPGIAEILQNNRPRADWRLLQILNVLQGFNNTNRIHVAMMGVDPDELRQQLVEGLARLQGGAPSGLSWGVSAVQLFNPNAAKGYSALKPKGTDRNDRTKEQWTDSLTEWLRYRGYFACACPFFMGSKGEHIRVLCPVPADISLAGLQEVATELRTASIYGNAPKLDALAVINLAQILIRRSEFGDQPVGVGALLGIHLAGRTPARVISGLSITNYQSLGQARAVSELTQLALPDWFVINSRDDADDWLAILDEHRRVVASLQADHSDEIGLLISYRRFLEQRGKTAADALIDFMGAYGAFLVPARDRGRRLPAFTTAHAHRVIGGLMADYVEILGAPGFQAVAGAIRRATVSAQALKAMGGRDYREIRYDLLPEIRRKRALPNGDQLVETLSDFLASYNYEN